MSSMSLSLAAVHRVGRFGSYMLYLVLVTTDALWIASHLLEQC